MRVWLTNFLLITTFQRVVLSCATKTHLQLLDDWGEFGWGSSTGLEMSFLCRLCLYKYSEISGEQILCKFLALTPFNLGNCKQHCEYDKTDLKRQQVIPTIKHILYF